MTVHPQSILHSAVEFKDGAVIAQLGTPDMRIPIQYALYYPKRRTLSGTRLNLFEHSGLTFEQPDMQTFRGLALAFDALKRGGNAPTVYNAANEKAVALFLSRKIAYLTITEMIETCLDRISFVPNPTVEQILETEQAVYEFIESRW